MYQHIITLSHQHIITSTHHHINTSTHQHINTLSHQHMTKNRIILPILFVLLFVAYYTLLKVIPADYNDIHDHAAFARQMCTGEINYSGNFLVYLLVNIFSFFTAKVTPTEISLCGLLALAGTYRFSLTQQKIGEVVKENNFHVSYWYLLYQFQVTCRTIVFFISAIMSLMCGIIQPFFFCSHLPCCFSSYPTDNWRNITSNGISAFFC